MFREHVRPVAVHIVSLTAPSGTPADVTDQLVDDLTTSLDDRLIRRLTETLSDSEMTELENALDAESATEIERILMLPKVQDMIRDETAAFVASRVGASGEAVPSTTTGSTYFAKVTAAGGRFLVQLHHDGSVTESDLFDHRETWRGQWREEVFGVAERTAGPGASSGKATGLRIDIGPYSAHLLRYSSTYLAGPEYRNGDPVGMQMLFEMGDEPWVLDIDRVVR